MDIAEDPEIGDQAVRKGEMRASGPRYAFSGRRKAEEFAAVNAGKGYPRDDTALLFDHVFDSTEIIAERRPDTVDIAGKVGVAGQYRAKRTPEGEVFMADLGDPRPFAAVPDGVIEEPDTILLRGGAAHDVHLRSSLPARPTNAPQYSGLKRGTGLSARSRADTVATDSCLSCRKPAVNEAAPDDLTDPNFYGHWETITIRYSDGDGMGHINNAVYAAWTEVARVTYIMRFTQTAPEWLDTVLARQTIDYLAETRFPGTVRVGARLLSIGNRSFRSGFGIFRDDVCLATSDCVNVFFDMRSRTSALPTPSVRAEMEKELAAKPVG